MPRKMLAAVDSPTAPPTPRVRSNSHAMPSATTMPSKYMLNIVTLSATIRLGMQAAINSV